MSIFFSADHHFGHKNVLKYCPNRKFASIQEHDESLIERWNERVRPKDFVFHLGDFGFNPEYNVSILKRLHGKKYLISGNHDDQNLNDDAFRECWEGIYNTYHEINVMFGGRKTLIVLCHYPLASWKGIFHGAFNLHGHVHSTPENQKLPKKKHRKDIGIDSREDLAPWEKDEVLTLLLKERINIG